MLVAAERASATIEAAVDYNQLRSDNSTHVIVQPPLPRGPSIVNSTFEQAYGLPNPCASTHVHACMAHMGSSAAKYLQSS